MSERTVEALSLYNLCPFCSVDDVISNSIPDAFTFIKTA